jgi:DNA-binding NtrC family response regulator
MTATPPSATTILVVDDEDGIRQALTRFLRASATRSGRRPTRRKRVEQQTAHQPQAMLCDIRMPETSGVELLPKVLAQDPDLAILMLTAIDEPRTAIECLKLGAFDYLIKPVDLDELELSLQQALRQRQLEDGSPGARAMAGA